MGKLNPKKMNLLKFREEGYLQEVNRQFFHPLGLALTLVLENDREPSLCISDMRSDPVGVVFPDLAKETSRKMMRSVIEAGYDKQYQRLKEFGWVVQPIGDVQDGS